MTKLLVCITVTGQMIMSLKIRFCFGFNRRFIACQVFAIVISVRDTDIHIPIIVGYQQPIHYVDTVTSFIGCGNVGKLAVSASVYGSE